LKQRPIIISQSNSITIPKQLRDMLVLQPGDCLDYEVLANGSIILARKECCDNPLIHLVCQEDKRNNMR
jgi:AbrB family looped-hinge helix DNA binding protein